MNDNYLEHHGIKGQKWGDRNGPPYPLKPSKHSAAEKKANKKVTGFNRDKNRDQRNEKKKNGVSDDEKNALIDALINNDTKALNKINLRKFSTNDLREVNDYIEQRNRINKNSNDATLSKIQRYTGPVNEIGKTTNTLLNIGKTGLGFVNGDKKDKKDNKRRRK